MASLVDRDVCSLRDMLRNPLTLEQDLINAVAKAEHMIDAAAVQGRSAIIHLLKDLELGRAITHVCGRMDVPSFLQE